MGNSFGDNLPVLQSKGVSTNEHNSQSQTSKIYTDDYHGKSNSLAKQDVLQALQKKMAQGDQLKNSELLLYQALGKETGQVTDLHQSKLKEDKPNVPEWFDKLPGDHKPLIKKETQDFRGKNIPAPPFLNEKKAHQQLSEIVNSKSNVDDKDSNDDQKTFEQDQRDEERRLFEMFQGDNNHVKDDYKGEEDFKNDGERKVIHDNDEYNDDKDNGRISDDDDYNEKDDKYVYGDQDHKVNPEQPNNDALI